MFLGAELGERSNYAGEKLLVITCKPVKSET